MQIYNCIYCAGKTIHVRKTAQIARKMLKDFQIEIARVLWIDHQEEQ